MSAMKDRLQQDLTVAIKERDEVTSATIRMVLTAVTNEEVAGKQARELSDADVVTVLSREAKKRRESADAFDGAMRPELADRERAELEVISRYLPQPLSDDQLRMIIDAAVADVVAQGLSGRTAMGAVMKRVQPQIKGRADGSRVAALVEAELGM